MPVDQYESYLTWLEKQTKYLVGGLQRQGARLQEVAWLFEDQQLPIESEVLWAAARLSGAASELNESIHYLRGIERTILDGNFAASISKLDLLEAQSGPSILLVDLRLGVEQISKGLEAQKLLAKRLKSESTDDVLSFLVHWISIRNEPTVTIAGFREQLNRRLGAKGIDDAMRDYFRFHLLRELPRDVKRLARILQMEQVHSSLDLFSTLVAVLQALVSGNRHDYKVPAIQAALKRLDAITDSRLLYLRDRVGLEGIAELPWTKADETLDALLVGNGRAALRSTISVIKSGAVTAREIAVSGIANALGNSISRRHARQPATAIVRGVSSAFGRRDVSEGEFVLSRWAANFAGLPFGRAIGALEAALATTEPDEASRQLRIFVLNCGDRSCVDPVILGNRAMDGLSQQHEGGPKATVIGAAVTSIESGGEVPSGLAAQAKYVCEIVGRLRRKDYAGALGKMSQLLEVLPPGALSFRTNQIALECESMLGQLSSMLERMASLICSHDGAWRHIPIERMMGAYSWKELEPFSSSISLSVVLDVLLKVQRTDDAATLRRYACEEYLASQNCALPSQLSQKQGEFERSRILYFLRYVSTPSAIDLLPALTSSRAVEEERIAICRALGNMDPDHEIDYINERLQIEKALVIRDGLELVDSSRIFVDEAAVQDWAASRLNETFQRYIALVNAGIGVAEDIGVVLQALTSQEISDKKLLEIPKNEADDILVEIMQAIRHCFLFDPAHGLDSYLSRRVRHGVIVGHLRSPVEQEQLITQRESRHRDYRPVQYWDDKLTELSQGQRKSLQKHFRQFAADFDRVLFELRDDKFHVKSPEHPKGIFQVELSPANVLLLRSLLRDDPTLPFLVELCIALCWANLEPSLVDARSLLKQKTSDQLMDVFGRLQSGLSDCANVDASYSELGAAVGRARAAVQRELESCAEWFKKAEAVALTRKFPLRDAIEIAIEQAKAAHRNVNPTVYVDVPEELSVWVGDLMSISDVTFSAIDNACQHASVRHTPNVTVSVSSQGAVNRLVLSVTNEIGRDVRTAETESRLQDIRARIAREEYDGSVRKEGGSGLMKIADTVVRRRKGEMQFGFNEDSTFSLKVVFETENREGPKLQ